MISTLENKLNKRAAELKGTTNMKQQLIAEAIAAGVTQEEAETLANKVIAQSKKTKEGNAFGKVQNPFKRVNTMATLISQLRGF
jgi:hypothetical protein